MRWTASILLLLLCLLTGCALQNLQPGMSREDVIAAWGRPTAELRRGGVQRLQYSRQPAGQSAVMVDLDAAGRVTQTRQVLNFKDFSQIDVSGQATRDDINWAFGRPARIDHVREWPGDIWTYRWNDGQDMFFWVYFDAGGVVRRTQQGADYLNIREKP